MIARALVAGAACLLQAAAASAQVMHPSCPQVRLTTANVGAPPDMVFTMHREGGHAILFAEGGVTRQTPARLASALATNGAIDEIWMRSAGGDANAGNDAARILRRSGVPVRIPTGWWCISACNFLFFGGAIRQIDPGGQFGVHMATAVNNDALKDRLTAKEKAVIDLAKQRKTDDVAKAAATYSTEQTLSLIGAREQSMALLTADDIDVVLRMGISRKLLSEVMYAQRADDYRDDDGDGKLDVGKVPTFRCLSQEQMRRYNVVNTD